MKTYNIMNLITPTGSGFNLRYINEAGTTQIFSHEQFYTIVRAKFNHMMFDSTTAKETNTEATNLANAKEEFADVFDAWKSLNLGNWERLWEALLREYDPIEIYKRIEEGGETTAKHKGTKTTQEVGEEGSETLEKHKGNKVTSNDGVFGYNSSEAVPSATNTSTQQDVSASVFDKDKRTFEDRKTTSTTTIEDISASVFDKDVLTFQDRISHGNIGVTPNSTLVEKEVTMRFRKYAEMIIADFINEFTYYVGGVE